MALIVLIVILGIPAAEIGVFIEVGGAIGVWPTIGGILLTAAIGMALFRSQGLSILNRLRESVERQEVPVAEAFNGVGLLLAGLMLFLPGFLTDGIGLLLFIPPLRILLLAFLVRGLIKRAATSRVWTAGSRPGGSGPTIIDGDFEYRANQPQPNTHQPGANQNMINAPAPTGAAPTRVAPNDVAPNGPGADAHDPAPETRNHDGPADK